MSDFIQEKTYEEILSEMTEDFRGRSGFYPDNASDIGIRLKVLASQIFSLTHKINWVWKQSSPLSATGDFLDSHAYEKGIARKQGKFAGGTVKFTLQEPLAADKDIEKGTVLATNTLSNAIKFKTTQSATIPASSTEVTVAACAEGTGIEGNVSAGAVKVICSAGLSMLSVVNDEAFSGGTPPETDDDLRQRIVESYQLPVYSGNESYYKSVALSDADVVSAGVVPRADGAGTVTVAIATSDPIPSAAVIKRVGDMFLSRKEYGINVTVTAPKVVSTDITGDITVSAGYDAVDICNICEKTVRNYIMSLGIGDGFIKADLYKDIMQSEGVSNIVIYSPYEDMNVSADTLITCGKIAFNMIK